MQNSAKGRLSETPIPKKWSEIMVMKKGTLYHCKMRADSSKDKKIYNLKLESLLEVTCSRQALRNTLTKKKWPEIRGTLYHCKLHTVTSKDKKKYNLNLSHFLKCFDMNVAMYAVSILMSLCNAGWFFG